MFKKRKKKIAKSYEKPDANELTQKHFDHYNTKVKPLEEKPATTNDASEIFE